MQKKKTDKFIDKFVKKDYNNELEEILEKKYFNENVKSILLSILYKIEIAYKDYEQVKPNIESKEKYIERILSIIKEDCNDIKIVKMNSKEKEILGNKTFLVEKKAKRIICYPIERKLLYCIAKISKNERIIKDKYYIIDRTLSDLINVGNNMDMVEPMRDFNGYTWTTIPREIESKYHNICYQNIRILVGQKFLNKWIKNKEFIIDYFEVFKDKIEEKYGNDAKNEFIKDLSDISILLVEKYNKKLANKLEKEKKEIKIQVEEFGNNKRFVQGITAKKKELTKRIKNIDETINNKDLLQREYEKRNELLPLEEKIFSAKILSGMMAQEREKIIDKIEKLNDLLNPQKYVEYKNEIEDKNNKLRLLDTNDLDKKIEETLIKFQKIFLECYEKDVKRIENKQDLMKAIYEFRYYCLLPMDEKNIIGQNKDLVEKIKEIQILLIAKAHEFKLIDEVSKEKEEEYQILKSIFNTRVIKLEDLCIKLVKEKNENYSLQVFDEDIYEEKIMLDKHNLLLKTNKKIKIFN